MISTVHVSLNVRLASSEKTLCYTVAFGMQNAGIISDSFPFNSVCSMVYCYLVVYTSFKNINVLMRIDFYKAGGIIHRYLLRDFKRT